MKNGNVATLHTDESELNGSKGEISKGGVNIVTISVAHIDAHIQL